MNKLKYPIGKYHAKENATPHDVVHWIAEISGFPSRLQSTVETLSDDQLDTPYREGGWSLRQVVHHVADSHLNGYMRIKLALTEDRPTIKPYNQDAWAELADMKLPVESSLNFIQGLHKRWTYLLESLDEKQLNRKIEHPKSGSMTVKYLIGLYAWHGRHHLGHIQSLKERKNWN